MAAFEERIQEIIERYDEFAFLLDFDGTLVDLVADPEEVHVHPDLVRNIRDITQKKDCAFAIVTGRAIGRLDRFLDGVMACAVGSHGAECRLNTGWPIEPLTLPMSFEDRQALRAVSDRHQCIFEDKIYTISMHLPFDEMEKDIYAELSAALAGQGNKYLIRKVARTYEIMQRGFTKGSGIQRLMQQPPFAGRRPIYIGDDTHVDVSLQIVEEMKGILLPARHHHDVVIPDDVWLETEEVRQILARLNRIEPKPKPLSA